MGLGRDPSGGPITIPTQSALPTLVNFDSTVTVTPKSAAFFNALLAELKRQLGT
jgi:hypothetical protein